MLTRKLVTLTASLALAVAFPAAAMANKGGVPNHGAGHGNNGKRNHGVGHGRGRGNHHPHNRGRGKG